MDNRTTEERMYDGQYSRLLVYGNIFDSPCQFIVNPVNCVGVMGAGLALQFKQRYPASYLKYKEVCDKGLLAPGKLFITEESDHYIVHFPTKTHWKEPSKYEYVEAGLIKLRHTYHKYGITSIAFPKLGCGCGGLQWNVVRPMMIEHLWDLPIDVEIFEGSRG